MGDLAINESIPDPSPDSSNEGTVSKDKFMGVVTLIFCMGIFLFAISAGIYAKQVDPNFVDHILQTKGSDIFALRDIQTEYPNGFKLVRTEEITPRTMFPYFEGSQIDDDNIFNMIPP